MQKPLEVPLGPWWRLDGYEVRFGYIRPRPRARVEEYDPWEEYRRARWGRKEKQAPYESLLVLLQRLRFRPASGKERFALAPESEPLLEAWCNEHGLLGMLPHRAQALVLAPRWEQPVTLRLEQQRERAASALRPTLRRCFRTPTGWVCLFAYDGYGLRDEPRREGQVVPKEYLPTSWPQPSALLQDLETGAWGQQTLSESWARFFPRVPDGERETHEYPLPLSKDFWQEYAEPVDDFVAGAWALHQGLWPLRGFKAAGKLTSDEMAAVHDVLQRLEALAAGTSPGLELLDDGSLRQVWRSPSLLASFAMMALQDLTGQRRVLSCQHCGALFLSAAYQALYCSEQCRYRAQKRAQRQREKEEKTEQHLQGEGKEGTK